MLSMVKWLPPSSALGPLGVSHSTIRCTHSSRSSDLNSLVWFYPVAICLFRLNPLAHRDFWSISGVPVFSGQLRILCITCISCVTVTVCFVSAVSFLSPFSLLLILRYYFISLPSTWLFSYLLNCNCAALQFFLRRSLFEASLRKNKKEQTLEIVIRQNCQIWSTFANIWPHFANICSNFI